MIWYLLDAFSLMEREKNRFRIKHISKTKRLYLAAIIFVSIFFFISITVIPKLYNIDWIGGVAFVIYLSTYIFSIKKIAREAEKEYEENTEEYKKTLENLALLLRKEVFQLYTEKQITKLIEVCNQILPSLQRSKSIFKPFVAIFTAILFPLITLALNILIDNFSFNASLQTIIWLILGSLYLISMYYFISPVIGDILDSEYKKLRRLRDMLSDIILISFNT